MEHRPLGRSGLSIAPLMLGGNVFGWTADETTSHAILDAFVAGGFNAIDTADVYSAWVPGNTGGDSEKVIGTWLKARGRRDDVIIATKVGMWPAQPGLKIAFQREDLISQFPDAFEPYLHFGVTLRQPLQGTLFRFPLRCVPLPRLGPRPGAR